MPNALSKLSIIEEYPGLVRFFDAFKTENKIVTDKDDLALDTNSYSVSNSAKNIRNEIFDNLRNNCEKDWVKQNEDIELVITPPVFNAFFVSICIKMIAKVIFMHPLIMGIILFVIVSLITKIINTH